MISARDFSNWIHRAYKSSARKESILTKLPLKALVVPGGPQLKVLLLLLIYFKRLVFVA